MRTDKNYSIDKKESVLLMSAEGNGFNMAIDYYNTLTSYIGWENKGIICAAGVRDPKDIANSRELEEAYKLGMSL